MEIKELHLRNIASIERADIDFSKDLTDQITGELAPIFLISGDTGAGKSAILDGISMALYATTPRTASVPNQKNNKFKDENGEVSNTYDIEQYTRIGISEKDDCYSEVVFIGNDGKEYRARLTLGVMLTRSADKATGQRHLKPRGAKHTVSVGGEEYSGGDAAKKIVDAIGLSFAQFSRMAMLAQGQFAAFLTGSKEERETILEQLTDTKHFSLYGKAISNIYKNAKDKLSLSKKAYDTMKQYTLSEAEIASLKETLETATKDKETNDKSILENDTRLQAVLKLTDAEERRQNSSKAMAGFTEVVKSDAYKNAAALIADWEATATQRQQLSTLRKHRSDLESCRRVLPGKKATFAALAADLLFRQDALTERKTTLEAKKRWKAEHAYQDELYTNAEAVIKDIELYKSTLEKLASVSSSLEEENGNTEGLNKAVSETQASYKKAQDACAAIQGEIDARIGERNALNPEKINKDLVAVDARIRSLSLLEASLKELNGLHEQKKGIADEIKADEKKLSTLLKKKDDDKAAYEAAEKQNRFADDCYNTMTSADDKIASLRQQLAEEKDAICPLCGQRIENLQADFSSQLSELGRKRQEAQDALQKAKKAFEESQSQWSTFSGMLEAKKGSLKTLSENIAERDDETAKKAKEMGLDTSGDLSSQITELISSLFKEESALKTRQKTVSDMQNKIDALQEEKKPLDKAAESAKAKMDAAIKAQEHNAGEIERLQKESKTHSSDKTRLHDHIAKELGKDYPKWEEDLTVTAATLRQDSKQYLERVKAIEVEENLIHAEDGTLITVKGFQDDILRDFPDWDGGKVTPKERTTNSLVKDWRDCASESSTLKTSIDLYEKGIKECTDALAAWYQKSGKDEKALDAIEASEPKLDTCKAFVKKSDEDLRSSKDAVTAAEKQKAEALHALGITDETQAPQKDDLLKEKGELQAINNELVAKITDSKGKLDQDSENVKKLKEAEADWKDAEMLHSKWKLLNDYFGGTRFRTLVQTYILRPLLNNANIYLSRITDRYELTCSEENEQLSIFVKDKDNRNKIRTATVLSGGERFMISLALSLALSSLNRPDMNVNILFIDEGFGTLDRNSLDSVMFTLEKLQEIAGESNRRVGIISHREELEDGRIPVQIHVKKKGEGRSVVEIIKS